MLLILVNVLIHSTTIVISMQEILKAKIYNPNRNVEQRTMMLGNFQICGVGSIWRSGEVGKSGE